MPYALTAQPRTKIGRQAKQELAEMKIPSVVYGRGIETQSVSVPRSEFLKVFKQAGYSSLIDLAINATAPVKVVIKSIQAHPLTQELEHIDFHQIRMDEEMTARIPMVFFGESAAVKTDGGTLIKSLDELEIRCLPADLPHEIQIDLSKLKTFEDAITVASLVLPKGVSAATEGDVIIATVARPLTEDELKKLEESAIGDVSTIKSEGDEKKAAEEAKKAEEAAVEEATK
jgi:large subunit ribosomal protein L25